MFLGQHEHVVDEKGRLMVPARFRELLGSNGYITLGFDQNLMVLPSEVFIRLSEHARAMSLTDPTPACLNAFSSPTPNELKWIALGAS